MIETMGDGAAPAVAVVLCTRDRPALLEAALPAVKAALRPGDEAVVVDSASVDPAVGRIVEAAGLRVERATRPGLTFARNYGAAATSAPIVAFTDDDCRPRPDWTAQVAQCFADPSVGFATGRALSDRVGGPTVSVKTDEAPRRFEGVQDPSPMGHGANLSVRRIAFEAVGGFDLLLGPGARFHAAEDQDLLYRIVRAGWAGVYNPDSVVVHEQWRTAVEVVRIRFHYGIGAGAAAMKVARMDGAIGRSLLVQRVWDEGVAESVRAARSRYKVGVASCLARAAGASVGALRAMAIPLHDGRYVSRNGTR